MQLIVQVVTQIWKLALANISWLEVCNRVASFPPWLHRSLIPHGVLISASAHFKPNKCPRNSQLRIVCSGEDLPFYGPDSRL